MTPDKIADIFDPESTRVFVIAEIGSNHDQDLHLAFKTIDAAVKSGADAVKFQSLNVMDLYLKPSAEILAIHKKIDLKESWHAELSNYCKAKGTIFLCSSTSLRSVDILENLGVPAHKLASAQVATFPFLIKKVIRARKPTLLSSGLVNRQELQSVVDLFKKANHDQFAVLHCNSIYPTPLPRAHLGLIRDYHSTFGCPVGFSDHTLGTSAPLAAAGMGARIIEKHFTLDRSRPTPDAPVSLNPSEFEVMCGHIREIEQCILPSRRSEIEDEEASFRNRIVYKLVMAVDKTPGDDLHTSDFEFRRHDAGIDCAEMNDLCASMKLKSALKRGELLELDHLEKK